MLFRSILVTHNAYMSPYVINRLNADGTPDPTFSGPSDMEAPVIKVQPDGKILLGGNFPGGIARLNIDGSVDITFGASGTDGTVTDILIQPDNKIIVVGVFTNFNGSPAFALTRLNQDGSTDVSFNGIGITDDLETGVVPNKIALLSDGKILIAGFFDTFNGADRADIVRLNSDGTVDCEIGRAHV